ncbi:transcriptional regulator, PadR family [Stackebrandtia albiflava]|uniref:Transcriptional regulator, PadR family n=1 Tax=Stackebrandtia albiflava TaxID=406432 RepID=A0A562VDM2_9ACTN|nr:PadR family transcriptional regulator [Stackebrandtia albiflava]TWJ15986.1 transcriptional regulator, PadR family [Stackebrandtia albiflava]
MLKLAILGFLRDHPLHGYDLKTRIAALTGHVKPIADGTLYPAIKRLETAGLLTRRSAPGKIAAPRHMLELTQDGIDYLRKLLREPDELSITDENRWFTLLAFLRHLENPREQAIVLRRRLAFLSDPVSYFYDAQGRPMAADEFDDPFRQGLLTISQAANRAEFRWLHTTIGELERH